MGILYNAFVCGVAGFTGLVVFQILYKIRKEKKVKYSRGLDCFTLLLGLIWIFVGIRNLFTYLNLSTVEIFIYKWLIGPLTYLHLIPAFYYIGWSFFKNKKMRFFFNGFFTFMALLAVFAHFKYGFSKPETTYWGNNIVPNELSRKLLTYTLFMPAFICIIIEFVRRFKKWREVKGVIERQLFGFILGFLIYAITGVVDALGAVVGWLMLLARIGTMLVPLTFYLFVSWED